MPVLCLDIHPHDISDLKVPKRFLMEKEKNTVPTDCPQ